ncbi:flagellar hook-length control protein FliK [Azospirillum sp. B506]|uniref:flagellar hook-length control protein FliK n=1 Tax=Azospirillum sp. B506 TaxID=137721 RepID=UPI0003454925|nr:flagellar hook-length control protein FliK [Azospirillum sp. B506]
MTSMPDAVAAPPRPAPAQRGGSSGDDARDEDFARLVDETAEEPDDATRSDRLRKRKASRPDDPAAVQSAITQAVVQSGSGTDAPLMPWMVAAVAAVPQTMPTSVTGATGGATAVVAAPETAPGSATPKAGQPAAIGQPPAGQAAQIAPTAAPQQTPEPAAADGSAKQSGPAQPVSADATAQGSTGQAADAPAPLQTAQATLPATADATPVATADAPPSPDGRESRRDESSDPRTAVRATRGTGRQGAAADKADQPSAAGTAPKPGQPAAEAASAPSGRSPAAPFTASPSAGGAEGAATGFEAVPTLPAQAATHYAAAAASGRAATAHSPAMAQLAAPLVRVAESGGGEFHIDLAPAELGRIRVVADVSDGKVSLTVQAEQADTLALLRRDLTQLERALGDAGLSLDGSNLQFSLQGDGQSRGFGAPDGGGGSGGWRVQAEAIPEPAADPVADRPMRPLDGLVDVTV